MGRECVFYTEMQVREDVMALYGFATQEEQEWFRILTGVQGVGMKVGLAILSVASPAEMHSAVRSLDTAFCSNAEAADSDRGHPEPVEGVVQHPVHGGLAVRAGYSDRRQFPGGVPGEMGAESRQGLLAVGWGLGSLLS